MALLSEAQNTNQPPLATIKLVVETQLQASVIQWKTFHQFHLVVTE
jgi:hypothetical protein